MHVHDTNLALKLCVFVWLLNIYQFHNLRKYMKNIEQVIVYMRCIIVHDYEIIRKYNMYSFEETEKNHSSC